MIETGHRPAVEVQKKARPPIHDVATVPMIPVKGRDNTRPMVRVSEKGKLHSWRHGTGYSVDVDYVTEAQCSSESGNSRLLASRRPIIHVSGLLIVIRPSSRPRPFSSFNTVVPRTMRPIPPSLFPCGYYEIQKAIEIRDTHGSSRDCCPRG